MKKYTKILFICIAGLLYHYTVNADTVISVNGELYRNNYGETISLDKIAKYIISLETTNGEPILQPVKDSYTTKQIGYGHQITPKENFTFINEGQAMFLLKEDIIKVFMILYQQEYETERVIFDVEKRYIKDIVLRKPPIEKIKIEKYNERYIDNFTEDQLIALISLGYNVGKNIFLENRSSYLEIMKNWQHGEKEKNGKIYSCHDILKQFEGFFLQYSYASIKSKVKKKNKGLSHRRKVEFKTFSKGFCESIGQKIVNNYILKKPLDNNN